MQYFLKTIICAGLVLLASCGKDKTADPSAAPNGLSLNLNGKPFAVNKDSSMLVVDPVKMNIRLTVKGSDGITKITFLGHSNDPRGIYTVRKFVSTSLGGVNGEADGQYRSFFNNVQNCFGRTLSGFQTYSPFLCNHPDNLILEIQAVNESTRTMSGRFSGTFCINAEPCDDKAVTNGQFQLSY